MTNFKVGQKVVCVEGVKGHLEKNKVYTITHVVNCPCGKTFVCWGQVHVNAGYIKCNHCHKHHNPTGEYACRSSRFRPLSYSTNVNFEVIANFAPHEGIETDVPVKKEEPATV